MSVALELEYEAFYPRLRGGSGEPAERMRPSERVKQRRRVMLGRACVVTLLILLMLPIRAIGAAETMAGSGPVTGHEYVVRSGDTLEHPLRDTGRTVPMSPVWSSDWPARLGSTTLLTGGASPDSLTKVGVVRCPWCAVDDDRVVDSRLAEEVGRSGEGASASAVGAIHDLRAGRGVPLSVVKRSGLTGAV